MMASKFILQQALSLAAPLTLLPLLQGTAGTQADQQPILFVLLLLVLPLPVTRKILFRLTFTTGPKGEPFHIPSPSPTPSLSLSFSLCMKTLISFCFWAFCLLLFVSMSPSKLFCYLFCLTRFFTGCCLCLLGCSPQPPTPPLYQCSL